MTVQLGAINTDLNLTDNYSEVLARIDRNVNKMVENQSRGSKKVVSEVDKLKSSYNKLAASLDPTVAKTQKYDHAVDVLTKSLKAGAISQAQFNHNLTLAQAKLQDTTRWTQRLGSEIGSSLKSSVGSYLAVGAVLSAVGGLAVSITKQIVTANLEAEASAHRVTEAIRRYGDTSGVTVKQVDDLASSISKLTGIDDEAIADAEVMALKYNRIGTEVFPRLTRAAVDLSAATGVDLSTAFDKIGKIVNQPLRGLTLLNREGYAVAKSQSDMVKAFVKSGDILSAQGVMLEIIEGQYGGAAVAARDTLGGAFTALGTTWENLQERLGENNFGPVREGIEGLISLLERATEKVTTFEIGWLTMSRSINEGLASIVKAQIKVGDFLNNKQESKFTPLATNFTPINQPEVDKTRKNLKGLEDDAFKANKGLNAAYYRAGIISEELAKKLGVVTDGHKKTGRAALEQTEAEDKLNKELDKQTRQIEALIAKQREQLRYSSERSSLATLPPGTDQQYIYEQLQRINEEHEYRLDLLAKIQQFGVAIGTQLAGTDRELRKLEKDTDIKFKLQFINPKGQIPQLRSGIIDLFGGVQSGIDQGMNNLLDHLKELSKAQALDTLAGRSTDPVRQANDEMYAALANENAEFWQDYSSDVRAGWIKSTEAIKTEMEKVKEAFKSGVDGALTASEAEKELARLRRELVGAQLDHITTVASGWQQFFNQIGSMFGGFAQSVSTALSNMISTAQAFQSAGSAIGGQAGGYISAAGPFFAVAGALVGAIQADNARIAQRQYTSSVDLGFGTGQMDVMGRQGRALANSLQAALDPILDVLASTLADLPNITILAREDGKGFKVQVYDTILGIFDTMEEAMDAAVLAAVDFLTRTEGLTATMRQVLENTQARTSEDLMHDLDFGQWYDNLGLGTAGQAIRDAFSEMRRGIDDALRLGLGVNKIKTWFEQQRREIIGGLLGVDLSAAQALRNLQGAAQALEDLGGAERARLQEILASQERELAEIVASGPRRNEETGRLESQEMWQREIDRLRAAITQYTTQLGEIPEALSDQEMALGVWSVFEKYLEGIGKYSAMGVKFAQMRVDMEFEETRLALVQMGLWEEWAQTFNDAYAAARREAGKPRGGRGGGAGDSVRDFIDDRRFQLSLDGMSEYRRQLAEIERQYREIGKPTAELIALRNQEIDQLNRLRNREVATNFQEFMGLVSPFDQIRRTAADLIADIKDSPFGDARKAAMIGRVMGEVDRQIHRMSQEMARGLFGEMLGDLERFGLEEGLQLQLRQSMAIIEHTLKMVHYQEEIEILRAKGKLTVEQMRLLDESFAVLRNVNPLTIAGGASDRQPLTPTGQDLRDALAQRQADEANQLAEALKRARESLNRYKDDGLDPLTKDLKEIFKNFAEIKLYMGATPEVVETFNMAVKNAVDRFLDPIRESQRDLFFSESSTVDPTTQWAQLQLERDSLMARFRAGDLSVVDEIAGFGSELIDLAGDVIPMGSRAYEQIQNDWDRFLSEVQISVPGMIDVDSAPMQVVGMNDLTAIGEAQVDRLDMLYASQVRTNEHLQNLNMKVGYSGGLDSVN